MRSLYRAARVHTWDLPRPGEWLLVDGRHVQRVGTGEPPAADRVVDLPGATVLPGFVDAHVHLTSTGISLTNADVAAARSRAELLALAAGRARAEQDPVVALQGFDETRWDDPEVPTRAELDAVTDRPLVIARADGHVSLANTQAITFAQVGDLPGAERDADGPTGRVVGEANRQLSRWLTDSLTPHRVEELQLAAASLAASNGVTAVHEMSMPHERGRRDLDVVLGHRDRLPVDVWVVVASMDVPGAVELGLTAIGGDLAADGSIGARTAALREPYADAAGEGSLAFADDELAGFFHDAHDAGLQVGMHAIGDRAIEQVLVAWERVYASLDSRERRHFRARRHRIEHMEMPADDQVERAAMLGLAASVQPTFDAFWGTPGGLYERALGEVRAGRMNPFRTMVDRGLVVGAGSDAPVTPLEPWRTVAALEAHHDPAQRLGRREAVLLHTAGSARLAHQEEKKGVLAPGSHADFAAYETDPLEARDVSSLRPVLTVSLGREVFAR